MQYQASTFNHIMTEIKRSDLSRLTGLETSVSLVDYSYQASYASQDHQSGQASQQCERQSMTLLISLGEEVFDLIITKSARLLATSFSVVCYPVAPTVVRGCSHGFEGQQANSEQLDEVSMTNQLMTILLDKENQDTPFGEGLRALLLRITSLLFTENITASKGTQTPEIDSTFTSISPISTSRLLSTGRKRLASGSSEQYTPKPLYSQQRNPPHSRSYTTTDWSQLKAKIPTKPSILQAKADGSQSGQAFTPIRRQRQMDASDTLIVSPNVDKYIRQAKKKELNSQQLAFGCGKFNKSLESSQETELIDSPHTPEVSPSREIIDEEVIVSSLTKRCIRRSSKIRPCPPPFGWPAQKLDFSVSLQSGTSNISNPIALRPIDIPLQEHLSFHS